MDRVAARDKVDTAVIRLYRKPDWILNLSVRGQHYSHIVAVRASPLTYPDHYICFLDANGREICMVDDPSELDTASQQVLREELERRYLTSTILRVRSARREGVCYFDADTSRGRRDFVVQQTPETVHWLGDHRLLLVDVDGNRFEAHDIRALDRKSAKLLLLIA
jgi:hypothetical protein